MTPDELPAQPGSSPQIELSPKAIKFGKVGDSASRRVKVRNRGGGDLVISSIALCTGTSSEFSAPAGPLTVAAKKSATVQVTYTPADDGTDRGCIQFASNDPQQPIATLNVTGSSSGAPGGGGEPDIELSVASLDFGEVPIGDTTRRTFRVQNTGGATLRNVIVNRCFQTSDEYRWSPTNLFSVQPGKSRQVRVLYEPGDEGSDAGCLEIHSNDPDEDPLNLDVTGSGVAQFTEGIDLKITSFKVRKKVKPALGQKVWAQLWVRNVGTVDEPVTATLTVSQDGAVVYEETMEIRDRPGDQGVSKFRFPTFKPAAGGDLIWEVGFDDDEPGEDRAFAVTRVEGAPPTDTTGYAVAQLRSSRSVSLRQGRAVVLKLWVRNTGTSTSATATLVGMQAGAEIYSESLPVTDRAGDRAATLYRFPDYQPDATGDILWMVVVDDGQNPPAEAYAVTRVGS